MQLTQPSRSPAAIWNRLIRPDHDDMSPDAARYFLKLTFDKQDLDRMHALAVKNQEGKLTEQELQELNNYRQIGLELDLLRAKARRAIKQSCTAPLKLDHQKDFLKA
jgi:uncharacterized protein YnzC (UPF0291/DUF896 family)